MLFSGMRSLPRRFRLILCSLQQSDSLPFFDALTEEQIQAAFEDEGVSYADEDQIFTPAITLWGFLSQALHKEEQRSCLAAVARIGVLLIVMGRPRCAENNGPYCRARGRLPLPVIERLTRDVAHRCEAEVPDEWLWKGRHVKLADGTTVTMADTEENQEAFPQQSCQKKGLGFPIARLVVLLSLATAMTTGMAMAPYAGKETGELALLRELFDQLDSNDVLLADKLYCAIPIPMPVVVKVFSQQGLFRCRTAPEVVVAGFGDRLWPVDAVLLGVTAPRPPFLRRLPAIPPTWVMTFLMKGGTMRLYVVRPF